MDTIAIDLNYDLYQDKRKHHSDTPNRDFFETEAAAAGFHPGFAKPMMQKALFLPEHSSLYNRPDAREQFNPGLNFPGRQGHPAAGARMGNVPFAAADQVRGNPMYQGSMRGMSPMGSVTNYQNISINQHNIGFGSHFAPQTVAYPFATSQVPNGRAGSIADDNLSFSNQMFGPRAAHYTDRGGNLPFGYQDQGLFGQFGVPSNRFSTFEITGEDWDPAFAHGKIVMISQRKYRSVKGVLFQLMEDVEEIELLFR